MKKFFLAISFIVGLVYFALAQDHGSCNKAVLIDTSSYGPVYADGIPNPLLAMPHTNGMYFEKPHTAVWFCIDIPFDTLLTFDLVPQNPTDDLDFLLFKDETAEIRNCSACRGSQRNFCDKSSLIKMIPVRTNIAHTDTTLKGMTGLSISANNNMEPPGKHSTYSKALQVKKDERYYLVVDNYTSAKRPFTLLIHFRFPIGEEHDSIVEGTPGPPDDGVTAEYPKGVMPIRIIDSITKAPVKARLKISWVTLKENKSIDVTTSEHGITLKQGQKISITSSAKGYLLAQLTYQAQTDSDKGITINMLKIKEHMKMIFKHIEFERGEAKFLPTATESLNDLLEFMNNNPSVKILIKGYVNDPYNIYDEMFDLNLSKLRAEAVYNYLANKGINKNRLDWRGLGNKEMVYPKPENEDQMEANRRVEVEIVK
jgi:outer membrane protein OmpA-like peptidoglycan-associated protein